MYKEVVWLCQNGRHDRHEVYFVNFTCLALKLLFITVNMFSILNLSQLLIILYGISSVLVLIYDDVLYISGTNMLSDLGLLTFVEMLDKCRLSFCNQWQQVLTLL